MFIYHNERKFNPIEEQKTELQILDGAIINQIYYIQTVNVMISFNQVIAALLFYQKQFIPNVVSVLL